MATPSVTDEDGDTPRTFVESITTGGSGSTEELVVTTLPSLFEQLRDSCVESITLPHRGYLVRRELPLGECEIEDEIGMRKFGTSLADSTRLCRIAAWDYPTGLVLINLDKCRTLVFSQENNFEPQYAGLSQALDWMQRTPGTFGLTAQAKAGTVLCALFAVLFHEEHGDAHLSSRAEALLRLVQEWA